VPTPKLTAQERQRRSAARTMRRFWAKVDRREEDQCWRWVGSTSITGYGRLSFSGGCKQAHRVAWHLTHGPVPDGLCVLHRCDNPPCVNPAHLFLGTHLDNVRDCFAKGRGRPPHSERHNKAKLTLAAVAVIRSSPHESSQSLAHRFGVTTRTIWLVRSGRTWRRASLTSPNVEGVPVPADESTGLKGEIR
jgi:hypothetical protein